MTDAPERIWAGWVGSPDWAEPVWEDEPDEGLTPYIREDLARAAPTVKPLPDVDTLANIIRTVDGSHSLGAGELAERILSALK
jgi:hypothetical protein